MYTDFTKQENPRGEACRKVQRLFATNDWVIRHAKCKEQDVVVHSNEEGDRVCRRCFEEGSDQRFLSRMAHLVSDLDAARVLRWKMFSTDTVSERIEGLKKKAIYNRRCKTTYDNMLSLDVQALHKKVSRNNLGKIFPHFCNLQFCNDLQRHATSMFFHVFSTSLQHNHA